MSKEKKVFLIDDWKAFKAEWQKRANKYSGFLPVDDAIESLEETISPGNLLASFETEVGSVFGHYTGDPKGDQVELKIVAIPDGLEGEQIEKGKEYHILILEVKK